MWIWWLISLVVLIVCFIFAYKVIMSSYDFLPADKKNIFSFKKTDFSENFSSPKSDAIWDLKNQLKKMEETSSFYEIQFSKMQQRLKALEAQHESQQQKITSSPNEEEDWKEMYYEENEVKEKLENELDTTLQRLEEAEMKLNTITRDDSKWKSLQSDYDARLNDLQSMQNNIGLLQRQLEASNLREAELEITLLREIEAKKLSADLQSENARLQSENEDLRRQIVEINKREREFELSASRLRELEKRISLYEEEKAKMIADLELMVNQNKIFSAPKHSL